MVTLPQPKVTGRPVIVFIERVELISVVSIEGFVAVKLVAALLKVTLPVPVEKVFAPVTAVLPFKETLPVPVENAPVPV